MGNLCLKEVKVVPWRHMLDYESVRSKYAGEQVVAEESSDEQVQLRAMLDEEICQGYIQEFASSNVFSSDLYQLWENLQEYKPVTKKKFSKLQKLIAKLKSSVKGKDEVPSMKNLDEQVKLTRALSRSVEKSVSVSFFGQGNLTLEVLTANSPSSEDSPELDRHTDQLFVLLSRCCFEYIYEYIYLSFKTTYEFESMCDALRRSYNNVSVDDFEYLTRIGEGGFGLIVHCRKLTTGRNYAMKIQPKAALLKHFRKAPFGVMVEMRAYSCCNHPYLASLAYALQTPTVAIMVMPLSACGDLARILRRSDSGMLSFERVQFYAAEIASALMYLHNNNLIYRDLKPGNILMNADGHVMLADFGSLADLEGRLHEKVCNDISVMSSHEQSSYSKPPSSQDIKPPVFSVQHNLKPSPNSLTNSNHSDVGGHSMLDSMHSVHPFADDIDREVASDGSALTTLDTAAKSSLEVGFRVKKRAGSLVGTIAYMAPEVIAQFQKTDGPKTGYTDAVDWWSLGITIFKLLFGYNPFNRVCYDEIQLIMPKVMEKNGSFQQTYTEMFGSLSFVDVKVDVDQHTIDIIEKLLEFDPEKRLGVNHDDIKSHPFFLPYCDWDLLEKKGYPPPYMPADSEILDSMRHVAREKESSGAGTKKYEVSPEKEQNFRDMLRYYNKGSWVLDDPLQSPTQTLFSKFRVTDEQQYYFKEWFYSSPEVIEEEMKALTGSGNTTSISLLSLFQKK